VGKANLYGLHITRMSLHRGERAKKHVVEEKGSENMRMSEFITMREKVHVVVESTRETAISGGIS